MRARCASACTILGRRAQDASVASQKEQQSDPNAALPSCLSDAAPRR